MSSFAKAAVIISKIYRECRILKDIVRKSDGGGEIEQKRNESYETFLKSTIVAFPFQKTADFITSKPNRAKDWTFSEVASDICTANEFTNGRHLSRFFGSSLMPFRESINYKESDDDDDVRMSFLNWKYWDTLQEDIGDETFLFLLQRCSFFVLLPTGNVYQITGPPIVDFRNVAEKRPSDVQSFCIPASKRRKLLQETTTSIGVSLPSLTIEHETKVRPLLIPWQMFLYSRNPHIGFPKSHFLEQLREKENENLIISTMFQEVFVADSVFGKRTEEEISILKSNEELKRLLLKFFQNHCTCDFAKMVWVHCSQSSALDSKKKKKNKKSKKKLREESTSQDVSNIPRVKVHRLLRSLVHRVVPLELFGSNHNKTKFQQFLGVFLMVDLQDVLSLNHLMDGVKIKKEECIWIPSQFDEKIREECYIRLVTWIFTSYVVPCLGGLFYVTELDGQRKRLFYVNKRYMTVIVPCYIDQAASESKLIELTDKKEIDKKKAPNSGNRIGNIRFIPKKLSVRPIVKVKSADATQQNLDRKSYKVILSILNYTLAKVDNVKPKLNGIRDIGALWLDLVKGWKAKGRPKLYFVKSDIMNCFGTMDRQKLREILVDVFKNMPQMTIHLYCLLYETKEGKTVKRFVRCTTGNGESVLNYVMKRRSGQALIIDLERPTFLTGREVVEKVMNNIEKMVLKIGKRYFTMLQGVCQGCPLSPVLCNLYYTMMEKQHLAEFGSKEPRKTAEMLVRYMDDYLYITPDLSKATQFLETLVAGIKTFNCKINAEKTQTNFEHRSHQPGIKIHSLSDDDSIQWYGMLLNQRNLETSVDYFRYNGQSVASSMSLKNPSKEGLSKTILKLAKLNVANVFLDSRINSRTMVITNLYHMSLMLAFRIHGLVGKLHRSEHPDKHPTFYAKLIRDCVNVVYGLIRLLTRKEELSYELRKNDTKWIFLEGILKKLRFHKGKYDKVIDLCKKKEFRRSICKKATKEFREIIGRSLPESFDSMLA